MDNKRRLWLRMQPRVMFWTDPHCGVRQLGSKHCRECGAPRPRDLKLDDFTTDAELELAVAAFIGRGLTREELLKGLFCSSCGSKVAGSEPHCPSCGNELETTDKPVKVQKRDQRGEFFEVSNPSPRISLPAIFAPTQAFGAKPTTRKIGNRLSGVNELLASILSFFYTREGKIALLVAGIALVLFLFWPRTAQATLTDTQFRPNIEINWVEVQTGGCYESVTNDCPLGIQVVSRTDRDYYPDGEVVVAVVTEMYSDPGKDVVGSEYTSHIEHETTYGEPGDPYPCSANDEVIDDVLIPGVCTPVPVPTYESYTVTQEVPVYATYTPRSHDVDVLGTKTPHPETWVEYTLDVARVRVETYSWTSGTVVVFPNYTPNPLYRESLSGNQWADYRVVVLYKGKSQEVSVKEEQWLRLISNIGQPIEVKINLLGVVMSIK